MCCTHCICCVCCTLGCLLTLKQLSAHYMVCTLHDCHTRCELGAVVLTVWTARRVCCIRRTHCICCALCTSTTYRTHVICCMLRTPTLKQLSAHCTCIVLTVRLFDLCCCQLRVLCLHFASQRQEPLEQLESVQAYTGQLQVLLQIQRSPHSTLVPVPHTDENYY